MIEKAQHHSFHTPLDSVLHFEISWYFGIHAFRLAMFYSCCNFSLACRRKKISLTFGDRVDTAPEFHMRFFFAAPLNFLYVKNIFFECQTECPTRTGRIFAECWTRNQFDARGFTLLIFRQLGGGALPLGPPKPSVHCLWTQNTSYIWVIISAK